MCKHIHYVILSYASKNTLQVDNMNEKQLNIIETENTETEAIMDKLFNPKIKKTHPFNYKKERKH